MWKMCEIARDMIQRLHHLDESTRIYQKHHMRLGHSVVWVLTIIFILMAYCPSAYRQATWAEFDMVLDLARGFDTISTCARVSAL